MALVAGRADLVCQGLKEKRVGMLTRTQSGACHNNEAFRRRMRPNPTAEAL